jgi:hypothetical protein
MDKQPAAVRMFLNLARRLDAPQKSVRQFVHVGILPSVDGMSGGAAHFLYQQAGKSLCGKAIPLVGTAFFIHLATNAFTNFSLVCPQIFVEDDRGTVPIKAKSRKAFRALRDFYGE